MVQRAPSGDGALAWRALTTWQLPAYARIGELLGSDGRTLEEVLAHGTLVVVGRTAHTLTLELDGVPFSLRRDADQLTLSHPRTVGRSRTLSRLLVRALAEASELRWEHR